MTRHLDDQEMAAAVAGLELAPDGAEHLGCCLECSRRVAALQRLIESRRAGMADGEPDGEAMRSAVLARIPESAGAPARRRPRWWRPVAAAAATVVLAVAAALLVPRADTPRAARTDLPVDEILAEVDAVLDNDSIPGFEVIDPGVDAIEGYAANGSS